MTFFNRRANVRKSFPSGFTLIELLVSSTILAIAIISLVGFIRKGRELEGTDGHRRRARAIIDSCFESNAYQPTNYAALTGAAGVSVVIEPSGFGRSANLTGSLTLTLTPAGAADDSVAGPGGVNIHYRNVGATVTWTEPEGTQSVTLNKRLSPQ